MEREKREKKGRKEEVSLNFASNLPCLLKARCCSLDEDISITQRKEIHFWS